MRLAVLLPAFAALLSSTAFAASPETDAFVAKTRLAVSFLHETSALAADRSESAVIRGTAQDELRTQPLILAALSRRSLPLPAPAQTAALMWDGLQTGRSVASDPVVSADTFGSPIGTGATMPAAFITIDRLAASKGGAFDSLYAAAQLSVLADLKATYDAYGRTGDDLALKQIAQTEAVATGDRIAALTRTSEDPTRGD